jgi:hypothetical protein
MLKNVLLTESNQQPGTKHGNQSWSFHTPMKKLSVRTFDAEVHPLSWMGWPWMQVGELAENFNATGQNSTLRIPYQRKDD